MNLFITFFRDLRLSSSSKIGVWLMISPNQEDTFLRSSKVTMGKVMKRFVQRLRTDITEREIVKRNDFSFVEIVSNSYANMTYLPQEDL